MVWKLTRCEAVSQVHAFEHQPDTVDRRKPLLEHLYESESERL